MPEYSEMRQNIVSKIDVFGAESEYRAARYIPPQQSANTLFHFMDRYEWLCEILAAQQISPRYCEERFDYLDASLPSLAFPMKCFCDIYLEKLHFHLPTYGFYGLGFSKEWLIRKKVQPIQYINPLSEMGDILRQEFLRYIEQYGENIPKEEYYNPFFRQLRYIKPITGRMSRDGTEGEYNFHDEQEWRFIPDIPADDERFDLVQRGGQGNWNERKEASDDISKIKHYVIPFSHKELKYIIVPTSSDSARIQQYIFTKLDLKMEEKLALISKILVFEVAEEDW